MFSVCGRVRGSRFVCALTKIAICGQLVRSHMGQGVTITFARVLTRAPIDARRWIPTDTTDQTVTEKKRR